LPTNGRPPKPEGQRVNRHALAYDWKDYPDVPFDGAPEIPKPWHGGRWSARTLLWWQAVSTMPHCVDWTASDWAFAFDALILAAAFHRGDLAAEPKLRAREKVMGTTADYRRNLRIRYVDVNQEGDSEGDDADDGVLNLDDYRRILDQ
jgi:hypothetical protein